MKYSRFFICVLLLFICIANARATHIVGGEVSYRFLGEKMISSIRYLEYEVNVTIYEDCQNGRPEAIAEDNPAFIGVYEVNRPGLVDIDSGVFFTPPQIRVPANFDNSCVSNVPTVCLLKKTFTKKVLMPSYSAGFVVTYQRCCRNNAIVNIIRPGDNGSTYFCVLPKYPIVNNSAAFKNYPPLIICLNNPLSYDHSAIDQDGDSLSYEFCTAQLGGSPDDSKPNPPSAPPYESVTYIPPFTAANPFTGFPPIQINPRTGLITGTPNRLGRYLVTVCCNEWRNGVLINTIKREFQFVVTDCSKLVVANIPQFSTEPNTYIVNCKDNAVHFVNESKGGFKWHWDFGVTGITTDTSSVTEPDFTYPDTGTFKVTLIVNPGSTCPDSIDRLVKIYPKFYAAFSDSGMLCPGSPLSFKDLSSSTIKPITSWLWKFGDGDSSEVQNPQHTYTNGGMYNVVLMSQNVRGCADTIVRKIIIQNFKPFAGMDTVIVKGESILFNATGGESYKWIPGYNLNNDSIYNPYGYYPDTGAFTYQVDVKSAFGCLGSDTIQVLVVGQAAFYVPNAFSPNGDGDNDIFRPIAVGFRSLNHFRIFNRWGEKVYFGQSLESGWDGNYKGRPAEMGVYFWELSYTDRYGKTGVMKGDVTLMR